MPHEPVSIFDSRYERVERNELRRRQPRELLTTGGELIAEIQKLCDELAQARQTLALHAEIKALNKERVTSLEAEAECHRGTVRVLSRMITDSLDSTAEGGACSPEAPDDSSESSGQSSCPDSSAAERPDDSGEGPEFDSRAGSARFEFATGEGRRLYCDVPCSHDDAQTTARVLGLALGKHVIARVA